jgi:hypothetical protein
MLKIQLTPPEGDPAASHLCITDHRDAGAQPGK